VDRFAKFIVQKRKLVLIIAIVLMIPSILGAIGTYINYDILTYLPSDLESIVGEQYLENDFKTASTAMITVENMANSDILSLKKDISEIEGVDKVIWTDDIVDSTIPKEMLPEDIQKFFYNDSGATMMIVKFSDTSASKSTIDAIGQIKKVMRKDTFLGGMSAIVQDTKALADKEMPIYVIIAVAFSLVILVMGLNSTIVPFIFLAGIGMAILYNFGTNYFLGEISYITKALATVLQLGVTMDFSIFLLHRYEEEKSLQPTKEQAMISAIKNTLGAITGSSLTTIAGFLAMCTMSLTLGKDIGIVMAKGVLIGVISTVTILPALIITFDRAIHRYTHKTLIPRFTSTSKIIVKHYKGILIGFIILIIPFSLAQSQTSVYYTLIDSLPKDLVSIVGTDRLKEDFNMTTTHFVMVDENLTNNQINEISNKIENLDGITQVLSYEKFIGGGIPQDLMPDEVMETFHAGGRRMIIVNSSFAAATDEQNVQLDKMNEIIKEYDQSAVISGEGAMTKDLISVSDTDFKNVSITSIVAVFLIILLVFRSVSIPVILVATIESAIFINMGIPYFSGSVIPFISGIVVGTIQLGATVDYAILMTTRYKQELNNGYTAKEAVRISIENCAPSIVTSGLAFFAATIGVALISKIELIKSLCLLISRGAIISMIVIIFVLPPILIVTSKIINKTSHNFVKKSNVIKKEKIVYEKA